METVSRVFLLALVLITINLCVAQQYCSPNFDYGYGQVNSDCEKYCPMEYSPCCYPQKVAENDYTFNCWCCDGPCNDPGSECIDPAYFNEADDVESSSVKASAFVSAIHGNVNATRQNRVINEAVVQELEHTLFMTN